MIPTDAGCISFDRIADIYEATRYIPPEVLAAACDILRADPCLAVGAPFLDAGVGTGRFARALTAAGFRVVGADISLPMLEKAHATAPDLRLAHADLRRLPFRKAAFAGALLVHVLHLIVDWQGVIDGVRHVLGPDGVMFVGSETGKRFRAWAIYFEAARDLGLTRPRLGAQTAEHIVEYLRTTGAEVDRIEDEKLTWPARLTRDDALDRMRRNVFSDLWHISDADHVRLVAEVERRLPKLDPPIADVEECQAAFVLWRAHWPS